MFLQKNLYVISKQQAIQVVQRMYNIRKMYLKCTTVLRTHDT